MPREYVTYFIYYFKIWNWLRTVCIRHFGTKYTVSVLLSGTIVKQKQLLGYLFIFTYT